MSKIQQKNLTLVNKCQIDHFLTYMDFASGCITDRHGLLKPGCIMANSILLKENT